MDQSLHDFDVALKLLWDHDPKGLALAVSFLEGEAEGNRRDYYRSQLIGWILFKKLDVSPYIERLRTVFLRDFEDRKDHKKYWFPWGRQIVQRIANPEIRKRISAHLDDPNIHIRRRARLLAAYLDYSRVEEAKACLVRLKSIKNEVEFHRNSTYAMVYQNFLDLVSTRIEIEEFSQRWQLKIDARQKYGGKQSGLSESEREEWLRGFNAVFERYRSSPIWSSVNRKGEKKIKGHDLVAVETGILYLEVDPYWDGSGYTKEWILDQFKYLDLTPYISRLQHIVLHIVDSHYCREFRHYCKVAPKIDSEHFRDALRNRLNNPDPNVAQRAQWLLDFLGRYSKFVRA